MDGHVLVTGGAGGIGGATARMAAARGMAVTVMARAAGRAPADALVAEVTAKGGRAQVVTADVTDEGEITAAFRAAEQGLGPLTALVNAAGISAKSRVADLGAATVAQVMAVNVTGLMLCCREAARRMSTAASGQGGAIVNISSMAATIGGRPGSSVYAASKGAVDVFTTGFAREVAAEGVRVNVVRPGMVATKMTAQIERDPALKRQVEASIPMGRVGQPDEIAELVLWLLSPAASFVTGAHVNAGGGGFHVAANS